MGILDSPYWNFRIITTRFVIVQSIHPTRMKLDVIDFQTKVPFTLNVPPDVSITSIQSEETYQVRLKVYTRPLHEHTVIPEFHAFFAETDVNKSFTEFVKAAVIDPSLFKFELIDFEAL